MGQSSNDEKKREDQAGKEGEEERYAVDMASIDTYTALKLFMSILASQSWVRMGLVVDPRTKKIEKDMKQAKIAIDCFKFMFDQLQPNLNDDEKKQLGGMLSDLQINFVTHQ